MSPFAPPNHNSIGLLESADASPSAKIQWFKTETLALGGFWSLGAVDRFSKKDAKGGFLVRQHQALVALPEGPSLLVDCRQALDDVSLTRSGGLGLRLAADIFNDHQVRIRIGGQEKVFGVHPQRDTWHDLQSRSISIEDQLRLEVVAGEGSFQLLQCRARQPNDDRSPYPNDGRAVEESLWSHDLYVGQPNCDRKERIPAGAWFRGTILRIDCQPISAPHNPSATVSGGPACWSVKLPDIRRTVAINLPMPNNA